MAVFPSLRALFRFPSILLNRPLSSNSCDCRFSRRCSLGVSLGRLSSRRRDNASTLSIVSWGLLPFLFNFFFSFFFTAFFLIRCFLAVDLLGLTADFFAAGFLTVWLFVAGLASFVLAYRTEAVILIGRVFESDSRR